jgi:predicted permease
VVITGVILPIFSIIVLGFLLKRLGGVEPRPFSRTQLYILSPALVFSAMARADGMTITVLEIFLYIAILSGVILGAAQGIAHLMKGTREDRQAMSLAAVFMNSGFYGIPVCMLAFGDIGFVYATAYVVASATLQSTLGIFIASAGRRRVPEALLTVIKVPLIWAIVVARFLAHFDALPPEPFMKMINLLGQSAIPLGLLLLGMQLEGVVRDLLGRKSAVNGIASAPGDGPHVANDAGPAVEGTGQGPGGPEAEDSCPAPGMSYIRGGLIAAALRIVGGFFVALVVIRLFDFEPTLEKVIIVESSMPTAVNAVVYATEFRCGPKLVAVGILAATLGSMATITLILEYLL